MLTEIKLPSMIEKKYEMKKVKVISFDNKFAQCLNTTKAFFFPYECFNSNFYNFLYSSLLHQKPHITAQDVEDNFDGNICRCTGYRPILDAMKSFTEDANIPGRKTIDIEVKHMRLNKDRIF